jgi:hypothetical protein
VKTLDATLHALAPFVTGALISHESLSRAARVVRGVPAAVTPHLGFECPLGNAQTDADFGFLIDPRHGGQSILAGLVPRPPLPQRTSADYVWQRIGQLCRCWSERGSEIGKEIRELWFEFDLIDAATSEDVVPSVFVKRAPASAIAAGHPRKLGLDRVLAALLEAPLAPAVNRTVEACLAAAPSTDDVTYLGLMLGRPSAPLRLCIRGLLSEEIAGVLSRIGWSGSRDAVDVGLVPLARLADRFTLAVDVGEVVGPRIGLECRLDAAASEWQPFLDVLVTQGACTVAKRDAVLRWTEWMLPQDETQVPSGHAAERIWLHGLKAVPLLVPTIMHIKVSCGPAGPIEAKAYLGVGLRWRLDPDSAAITRILQSRE